MRFSQLIKPRGTVSRKDYFIWGLVLIAIKYNFDRLLALSYGRSWFITDYFVQTDKVSILGLNDQDQWFYLNLIIFSLPFIWVGTVLTVKRLRDAALPLWLVLLFFVPFLNMIFFLVLSILPKKEDDFSTKKSFFDRLMPVDKLDSAALAVILVSIIAFQMAILFVNYLEAYGWGLFIGVPFFIGFASVLIYGYHHHRITYKEAIMISSLAIVLFGIIVFITAFEGIICLAMASPILFSVGWIGAIIGYYVRRGHSRYRLNVIIAPLLMIPLLGYLESWADRQPPLFEVKTQVIIDAPKQAIWDELVAFSEIPPPEEWLFSTGIAYPTHAEIEGQGVGAVRHCHFTTGAFVEPITVWEEPHLLQFSVDDQPPPMVEWGIYDDLHMEHLDGYFQSEKGQFQLEALDDGTTKLVGTTWYRHDIWPTSYWRLWSDYILHQIHLRVLNHIKQAAEKN